MAEYDARRRFELDHDRDREREVDLDDVPALDVGKRTGTDAIPVEIDHQAAFRGRLGVALDQLHRLSTANANHDAFGSSVAQLRVLRALDEAARVLALAEDPALAPELANARHQTTRALAGAFRPSKSALDERCRFSPSRPRWDAESAAWTAVRREARIDRRAESGGAEIDGDRVAMALAHVDDARGGAQLPDELARRLAAELGADLSNVRVHTDGAAARAAISLGARAFAIGDDIYFAAGAYDPSSPAGIELIAHEVVHVVQHQRGSTATGVSKPGDAHERQADTFASRFSSMSGPVASTSTRPVASRSRTMGPAAQPPAIDRAIDRAVDPAAAIYGGATETVGALVRVAAPAGIRLHDAPTPTAAKAPAIIGFGDPVVLVRRTPEPTAATRWAYVVALSSATGGFIEERYLATDPPEPTAKLVRVTAHETLAAIAVREYGSSIAPGHDVRLLVQGLYLANRTRPGVHLINAQLSTSQRVLRDAAERRTLEVYKGARVDAGTALWIPSIAYLDDLASRGAITSGTTTFKKEARMLAELGDVLDHIAEFLGGVVAGVFEGIVEAVVDVLKGAVELVKLVSELVLAALRGRLAQLWYGVARELADLLQQLSLIELAKVVGAYVADRWTSSTWFGKGEFLGEAIGYVAASVVMISVSSGGSFAATLAEAASGGSKLAKAVLALVKATEIASNPLAVVERAAAAVELGDEATSKIKNALAKDSKARSASAEHVTADTTTLSTHEPPPVERPGHAEAGKTPSAAPKPKPTRADLAEPFRHPEYKQWSAQAVAIGMAPSDADRIWTLIVEGLRENKPANFEAVADFMVRWMKVPKGKAALWSGGIDLSDYAVSKGMATLESQKFYEATKGLKLYENRVAVFECWKALSRKFVEQLEGVVNVYIREWDPQSVLVTTELEVLKSKGLQVKFHAMDWADAPGHVGEFPVDRVFVELDAAGKPLPHGTTMDLTATEAQHAVSVAKARYLAAQAAKKEGK